VTLVLPLALVVYAAIAIVGPHWWISGVLAPALAALLWMRHPRARFSAYVFFSAVVLRGVLRGLWPLAAFGATAILIMQTAAARRAWPRLRLGVRPGDRMARP
jgi:hypothetical protein